jgi:hypothetical protein
MPWSTTLNSSHDAVVESTLHIEDAAYPQGDAAAVDVRPALLPRHGYAVPLLSITPG